MSVLIKGMEMPVTCCHCPLMGYDPDIEWVDGGRETQGAYICVITHELIDNTKREEHCPLVPVPPHGDLIDREWLIDIALHLMNIAKNDDIYNGVKWLWQYIIESTTIIEADRNLQSARGIANNSEVIANNTAQEETKMNCFDCKNRSVFPNEVCPLCHDYDRYEPKPVTNADRIRSMTDEELSEFFETLCPSYKWTFALRGMTWFGFLKQEAEPNDS